MGKNKRKGLHNRVQDFISSYSGKVILNYAYSWGAAVVILGSLFKLTHLPGANFMLFLGMGTEVLVFFISAFDKPYKSYKWESVFPQIKISGASDKSDENDEPAGGVTIVGGMPAGACAGGGGGFVQPGAVGAFSSSGAPDVSMAGSASVADGGISPQDGTVDAQTAIAAAQLAASAAASVANASHGSSAGIVAGAATEPVQPMDAQQVEEVKEASEEYMAKLKGVVESLDRFQQSTASLSEVSEALVESYKMISDNSGNVTAHSKGYVYQMENLNRNLSGLNTIYEIQLHSISAQLDTIKQVNEGLTRMKDMYDGSKEDSEKFHQETERMVKQIEELNAVYARMLQAMTVNMR